MGSKRVILLVCGGNTCRSPMAKVILNQMLKAKGLEGQFDVDSAARGTPDGTSAHPNARETITRLYGEDLLASHVPKALTNEIVKKADLIMVMQDHMKSCLPTQKLAVLGIPDPFGLDIRRYGECAEAIERRLKELWLTIIGSEPAPYRPGNNTLGKTVAPRISSPAANWVYDEVFKIAERVDYGRGEHAHTVTRLVLNMYDDMVAIDLIRHTADKRKLTEIVGLSHDIGVGKEKPNEGHQDAGLRMLKKELWNEELEPDRKELLAVILYAVFYHRDTVPEGKLSPLVNIPLKNYRDTAELVALLRVADGLDYGWSKGSPDVMEKVGMARTPVGVECRLFPRRDKEAKSMALHAYGKREVFEATFGELSFWLPGSGKSWVYLV